MFSSSVWPLQLQPAVVFDHPTRAWGRLQQGWCGWPASVICECGSCSVSVSDMWTTDTSVHKCRSAGFCADTDWCRSCSVTTDEFIFLITANGLWKTCLTSVLFSKMHYQALYCCYFVPLYCNQLYSVRINGKNMVSLIFVTNFPLRCIYVQVQSCRPWNQIGPVILFTTMLCWFRQSTKILVSP